MKGKTYCYRDETTATEINLYWGTRLSTLAMEHEANKLKRKRAMERGRKLPELRNMAKRNAHLDPAKCINYIISIIANSGS